ncbi:MAG TPA: hypothetical protein VF204_09270 [Streptosporangiaceae bacterium]
MSRLAGVILAACCGAASVACGTVPAMSASPAARAARSASASAAPRPVAFDCKGQHDGQVQPGTVYLDCMSGNAFVKTPSWAYWTAEAAKTSQPGQPRTAVLWVNTCTPMCAAGHYRKYKAVLSFFRPRTANGTRYYTRMRLRYTHGSARDYTFRWGTYPGATLPGWIGGPSGPGA